MKKKGRIIHDYSFNYFGGDRYEGKTIGGASVNVLFECYDHDGKERLFTENDDISSVLDVRFDRDKVYQIDVDPIRMKEISEKYGLKTVSFRPYEFYLYYLDGHISDDLEGMDEKRRENIQSIIGSLGDVPVQSPMQVSEDEFRKFLLDHADDFDIMDNRHAQTCSVGIKNP